MGSRWLQASQASKGNSLPLTYAPYQSSLVRIANKLISV